MENTYCTQLEYIADYLKQTSFYIYAGPAARIRAYSVPKDYFTCKSIQHFKPYLTPNLPKRFHYANNIRIDKVHLLVDQQWLAVRDNRYTACNGGNHGYDNEFKSMQAIFLGYGPGFKEKTEVDPFENIEVYNLMCDLLHITPAPNNGTHGSLNHLLKNPFYNPSHAKEESSPSSCPVVNLSPPSELGCTCNEMLDVSEINKRLNLTETNSRNLPYGRPRVLQKENTYCVLSHHGYVSGYSYNIWMPLWTAYTVNNQENTSSLPPTVSDCLRADVRIPVAQSQNCSDYPEGLNFTRGFLYPPNFNSSGLEQYDALLTSNIVPMYPAFGVLWDYFHNVLLQKYSRERNGINVISGPVFDYNYDVQGNNPSFTPLNCSGSLEVLSFILPHRPDNTESCAVSPSEWVEKRVQAHVARVRDVELLTGLDFYQERQEPVSEILQLKTFLPTFETDIN
uniref:Venom phosphodiesterase 1-like n=1 Tax=Nothoprocta perdicaria TaxID=30464 RepID=A0A8C6ZEK1_NOTPE